jgi:hypothetical protein
MNEGDAEQEQVTFREQMLPSIGVQTATKKTSRV